MIREMQHTGERSREEMEYERAHRRVVLEAAREGIVLLENQGILPLQKGTKVQVLGAGARRTIKGGTGSGDVNERESVSIEEGLRRSSMCLQEFPGRARTGEMKKAILNCPTGNMRICITCRKRSCGRGAAVFFAGAGDKRRRTKRKRSGAGVCRHATEYGESA